MKKQSHLYDLVYTRDTTQVMQQQWLKCLRVEYQQLSGKIPASVGVDYMRDGVVEVWQHRQITKYIYAGLARESRLRPQILIKRLKKYESDHKILRPYWKRGYCANTISLIRFIKLMHSLMQADLLLSFLANAKNVQPQVLRLARRLRAEDNFFAYSDRVVRQSIIRLWPRYAHYVTAMRTEDLIKPYPSVKLVQRRWKNSILLEDGAYRVGTLDLLKKFHSEYKFIQVRPKSGNKFFLRGRSAVAGKVQGKVRLVRSNADGQLVKQGEIIVSAMTTPAMVQAMGRAKAIVTDEGGLTCHAAVVARELGKPCVIATKVATKVFRNGDFIEVDADHGVVRKIKHHA